MKIPAGYDIDKNRPVSRMTVLSQIVCSGLAYAALGVLGLLLAVPPGYASPVFPAAGLAVALILNYGSRILPGIWLGSLTINLYVATQNSTLTFTAVAVAAILACGATLQAWAAGTLLTRWTGTTWKLLESEKDIALFLLFAAPVACLVSASWGITTLYLAGIISGSNVLFSWWNWWIGDILGVLTFTPLTLTVLLRKSSPWKERLLVIALPMVVTLCVVAAIFVNVSRWEVKQQLQQIATSGTNIAQLLDRRMVAHQEALSALSRLIEVTPDMSFSQFEHFTRITLEENPDIFALSFNPYVLHQDRRQFEQRLSRLVPAPGGYRITERDSARRLIPAGDRPMYVPVGYIAPLEKNLPALGFDINSDPHRHAAIKRSIRTAVPAVTAPIHLVQDQKKLNGVLLLNPAHEEQGAAPRQQNKLIGFAVAVIKVDELVQIALHNQLPTGMIIRLSDPQAPPERRVLFQSDHGEHQPIKPYTWQASLSMADRAWQLDVYPTADYLHKNRPWLAWGTGIAGLLFAALLQVVMLAMTGRAFAVQRLVDEQTIELSNSKQELELLNKSLLQRVDEAIVELRLKDQVLIVQGRQAAMGEMIGNIAHQWRQPLNALSMLLSNLQFAYEENQLTADYLNESIATADRLIKKMSTTINDFRNFFSPDKTQVPFSAHQQISQAVDLVDAAFKNNNITISVEVESDLMLFGYPNEYSQVLLNLLSNAKDAILDNRIPAGCIRIKLSEQDGKGIVTISDNGGGIPEGIITKIFEPYFSTKKMGTGIGLYMSKMIIERNMGGLLNARNIEGGCEFSVVVPLAGEQP